MNNSRQDWKAALFLPGELIGYKSAADHLTSYVDEGQQFFHINPLKERVYGARGGAKENIASYRNILIEWDSPDMTLRKQANLAARANLPYNTCTFSGGKSLHYIISLNEPFTNEAEYVYFARLIMSALGSDISMSNVNRVSRTPNAIRSSNGTVQELREVTGRKLSKQELLDWLITDKYMKPKVDKVRRGWAVLEAERARAKLQAHDGPKTILPAIYRHMVEGGRLHPSTNSRHESLVKFASWLKANWHAQDEIEELLRRAAESLGIGGRGDVEGIVKWIGL